MMEVKQYSKNLNQDFCENLEKPSYLTKNLKNNKEISNKEMPKLNESKNIIKTESFSREITRNGKNRMYTFIFDNNGNYKVPKFTDLQVSTMTVICHTNLIINTDKFYKYIPITDYVIVKKKRGRKKKIQPEDPNRFIPAGSIISNSNQNDTKGVVIKTKKKSKKYFRHAITTEMMLDNKKIINVKISKQGKFQMTGCKNIQNAVEFIKHLYGLLIEAEEWTGEILFSYRNDNDEALLDDSNENLNMILERPEPKGLTAIFKVAMRNLDFASGYKIRRDLLNNFINKYTEFRSIFESSIATSVNIKLKSSNKFDKYLNRLRITSEGECIEDTISSEEFYNALSPKEQKDEYKKEPFHTFLVFATGRIIMSSTGMEMCNVFNKLVKILIEHREKIEERTEKIEIDCRWLDE